MKKRIDFKEFDLRSRSHKEEKLNKNIASSSQKSKIKSKLYVLLAAIIVVIGGVILFKFYSQQVFNSFLKDFQNNSNEVFKPYKESRDISTNLNKLSAELNIEDASKSQRNKEILVSLKRGSEQQLKLEKEKILPLIKKWEKETDNTKNSLLWLTNNQKSLVSDLSSATKSYRESSEKTLIADEKLQLGFNALLDEEEALIDLSVYDKTQRTPEQTRETLNQISSLEKYSRQDFSFKGLSQFSLDYPDFYKYLETIKDLLASYYNAIVAKATRDEANYNSNAQKYYMLAIKLQSYSDPFKDMQDKTYKPYNESTISADEKIISAFNKFKNSQKNVRLAYSMYVADILTGALSLYKYDHNSKFPITNNANEMIGALKKGDYIDKQISIDNTFEYQSNGDDYKITFVNDLTGQKEVVEYLSK